MGKKRTIDPEVHGRYEPYWSDFRESLNDQGVPFKEYVKNLKYFISILKTDLQAGEEYLRVHGESDD